MLINKKLFQLILVKSKLEIKLILKKCKLFIS